MVDFFFFTEFNKLNNQISGQEFGAIDEDNYRLNNLFTATSDPKAFAVCDGIILVQDVSETLVNIIIKPTQQPNLGLQKINYFLYKGIKKESMVTATTTIVVNTGTNDLATKIWTSHDSLLAEGLTSEFVPSANKYLGLEYHSGALGTYKIEDTNTIDKIFYDENQNLFPIKGGDHIGDFDSTEVQMHQQNHSMPKLKGSELNSEVFKM